MWVDVISLHVDSTHPPRTLWHAVNGSACFPPRIINLNPLIKRYRSLIVITENQGNTDLEPCACMQHAIVIVEHKVAGFQQELRRGDEWREDNNLT